MVCSGWVSWLYGVPSWGPRYGDASPPSSHFIFSITTFLYLHNKCVSLSTSPMAVFIPTHRSDWASQRAMPSTYAPGRPNKQSTAMQYSQAEDATQYNGIVLGARRPTRTPVSKHTLNWERGEIYIYIYITYNIYIILHIYYIYVIYIMLYI